MVKYSGRKPLSSVVRAHPWCEREKGFRRAMAARDGAQGTQTSLSASRSRGWPPAPAVRARSTRTPGRRGGGAAGAAAGGAGARGSLPGGAGTPGGFPPPPLGQALRPGGPAARHEEGRVAAPRRETAGRGAAERAAREAERGAGAPAQVGTVALFPAVDHAVAAERAAAGIEVALRALEHAGGEAERGAGGPGERVAVALLPLRDGAIAAQRGERLVVAGVARRIGPEDARPVVHVAAGERAAPEGAIVRGDRRRPTEGTVLAGELAVADAVDHAGRLAGGLRRGYAVAHPARARRARAPRGGGDGGGAR